MVISIYSEETEGQRGTHPRSVLMSSQARKYTDPTRPHRQMHTYAVRNRLDRKLALSS